MRLNYFYLNTPIDRYEYTRLPINMIPEEIIQQYNILPLVQNGYVYIDIQKGMYGLTQDGLIENLQFKQHLVNFGYAPTIHTPGLWHHKPRPITFYLVVYAFGFKYEGEEYANHLIGALEYLYKVTTDWKGKLYCRISLRWDYDAHTVDLSIPGYAETQLHKSHHQKPPQPEHSPNRYNCPQYGVKQKLTKEANTSDLLSDAKNRLTKQVVGSMVWYTRAIDTTMRVALSNLSSMQTACTRDTSQALYKFFNYCTTHPDALIC